jgi:predicted Fe-Mo cluster-binding NifX family protein
MKIAVTATGDSSMAAVDLRFGRAAFFLIYDTEAQSFETITNSAIQSAHGAGVQAAQLMINRNISTVLTGRVGPNAYQILKAAGIDVRSTPLTTVADSVHKLFTEQLPPIEQAAPPHGGYGRGRNP